VRKRKSKCLEKDSYKGASVGIDREATEKETSSTGPVYQSTQQSESWKTDLDGVVFHSSPAVRVMEDRLKWHCVPLITSCQSHGRQT